MNSLASLIAVADAKATPKPRSQHRQSAHSRTWSEGSLNPGSPAASANRSQPSGPQQMFPSRTPFRTPRPRSFGSPAATPANISTQRTIQRNLDADREYAAMLAGEMALDSDQTKALIEFSQVRHPLQTTNLQSQLQYRATSLEWICNYMHGCLPMRTPMAKILWNHFARVKNLKWVMKQFLMYCAHSLYINRQSNITSKLKTCLMSHNLGAYVTNLATSLLVSALFSSWKFNICMHLDSPPWRETKLHGEFHRRFTRTHRQKNIGTRKSAVYWPITAPKWRPRYGNPLAIINH